MSAPVLPTDLVDVVVVGYGPVGQALANLLGRQGHRTVVLERWRTPYTMPRAVAFDGEAARILTGAGVGAELLDVAEPSGEYRWVDAAGGTLLSVEADEVGHGWWPDSLSMYQPALEEALARRGQELGSVTVLRGREVVELHDLGVEVEVVVQDPETFEEDVLRARWVVGCDGANSFVRGVVGSALVDLDFSHDWLICDVAEDEPRPHEPNNLQVCDPARPRTHVSAGPGHRRFEFMRVGDETVEDLESPASIDALLGLFGDAARGGTLERHAVYRFSAQYADRWRAGRLLLAGDAAHVMPPFAAQGMCSGFRDAANLAWKLDLVLRGRAGESLLDTYAQERRQHVQHAMEMSVELGKIICQDDPAAAATRDEAMRRARDRGVGAGRSRAAVRSLLEGFLDPSGPAELVGALVGQGRVALDGREGLFDDVVSSGFVLLCDGATEIGPRAREAVDRWGITVVPLVDEVAAPSAGQAVDLDGRYLPVLRGAGVRCALVRPDLYVYGAAADGPDALLAPLVDAWRT